LNGSPARLAFGFAIGCSRTVQKHRKDGLSLLAPHCYVRVAAGVTDVLAISERLCSIAEASR
jgi:hypothetical protein